MGMYAYVYQILTFNIIYAYVYQIHIYTYVYEIPMYMRHS